MEKGGCVYITTNKRHTVLYTGVTADIGKRSWQHKECLDKKSFTYRYNVNKLVYYESFEEILVAIAREKQIKAGSRQDKIKLIESINPNWKDLSNNL